ncbi:MAG: serine/threonine protein kinase, partial [Nostoc sp.]
MPRILWPQTTIQSTNGSKSAVSSSSLATVSVGGAKSVNASSRQTQKSLKFSQVLIGLGVGCFAVVIAAINQPNTKNPVLVSPVENVPVAIPSP